MESGHLTWVLTSAALVLFMTPGLAFFYGGMDRGRNVLNMLMMNFYCMLIVPLLWIAVGYSLAQVPFGNDFIGSFDAFFLKDITEVGDGSQLATIAFLGMFAAITPALISGAVADRMKFSAWALFVPLWFFICYVPIFKWVYGGWLGQRGSLDFAGGTAIHVNAGIAALAAVLVLGRRKSEPAPPHSMPLVMIGTGILWFGWFGFNAGSALASNGQTAQAFMNTFFAAAAAGLAWVVVEWVRDGHPTNLGAASGIVAGLVAITPAAGYVSGASPMFIGIIAGVDLLLRRAAQDQGRLRRCARRGRRALRRRARRLAVRRAVRQPRLLPEGRRRQRRRASRTSPARACSTAAGCSLLGEQALANGVAIVWSFVFTLLIMVVLEEDDGRARRRECRADRSRSRTAP